MKIFLSWSGPLSRDVARALRSWFRSIIQATRPWMSEEDIAPGKLWFGAIDKGIEDSKYGIICVTADNRANAWLLWEAGALYAQFHGEQFVVPLLINLKKSDLRPPLSNFQVVEANNKAEMMRLLRTINLGLESDAIPDDLLETQMERCWQELQDAIAKALKEYPSGTIAAGQERTFKDAADLLLRELKDRRSIGRYKMAFDQVRPYLDHLPLSQVDEGTLAQYMEDRLRGTGRHTTTKKKVPAMAGTINKELQVVRQVLSRAVGLRWLSHAPAIRRVQGDRKVGHTLSWADQDAVLSHLPPYAQPAYLFALNTGLRRQEIVDLRWDQLEPFAERETSVFVIPLGHRRQFQKYVALNSIARQIVREQRGKNPKYVFTNNKGKQFTNYGTKTWVEAWNRAGLPRSKLISTGVDNLRDTFEYRLRVAKVPQEDIETLKGSTKADSLERNRMPAIGNMIDNLEKITVRPASETIFQKHAVKWTPKPGKWSDRRKWRGRRVKGGHLAEPNREPTPDSAPFELTGR